MNFYYYITLIASAIFMVNGLSIEIGTCDYCSDDFVPIYNGLDIVIGSCNQFQVTTIDTFYDDWQAFAQSCYDFNDQFVSWDGTVTDYDFNALSDGLVAFEESIGDGFEVAYTVDTDYFDDNIVDVWYSLYDSFGRVVEICPTKYQKHISKVAERIKKAIKKYCKKNNCN